MLEFLRASWPSLFSAKAGRASFEGLLEEALRDRDPVSLRVEAFERALTQSRAGGAEGSRPRTS